MGQRRRRTNRLALEGPTDQDEPWEPQNATNNALNDLVVEAEGLRNLFDIQLDGEQLRWNGTDKDWINSKDSLEEVGSIHTVQGYDLNYAGVIIGPDLRLDPATGRIVACRESYRDKKGKENTGHLKDEFGDDDLLTFIRNIYGVLLTRGMRGTYIYVCDPALRERLAAALTR